MKVNKQFTVENESQLKTNYIDILSADSLLNEGTIFTYLGGRVVLENLPENKHVWITTDENSKTELSCSIIQQNENAWVDCRGFLGISLNERVLNGWDGKMNAGKLTVEAKKHVVCNAECRIDNEAILAMLVPTCRKCAPNTNIELASFFKVNTFIQAFSRCDNEEESTVRGGCSACSFDDKQSDQCKLSEVNPSLVISNKISCTGIVANNVEMKFTSTAKVEILPPQNIESVPTPQFDIQTMFLMAMAVRTCKGSIVTFKESKQSNVICSEKWIHEGKISFESEVVLFEVNDFSNYGEIENMVESVIIIRDIWRNNSLLAAARSIEIHGIRLHNSSKIEAETIEMEINSISQDSKGSCKAEGLIAMKICRNVKDLEWNGEVSAENISIESLDSVSCNAKCIASRKMTFRNSDAEKSVFVAAGYFGVMNGDFEIISASNNEEEILSGHRDFILSGTMKGARLIGLDTSMRIKGFLVLLSANIKTILHVHHLDTLPNAKIALTSECKQMNVICSKLNIACDASMKLNATQVFLKAGELINQGQIIGFGLCYGIGVECNDFLNVGEISPILYIDCATLTMEGTVRFVSNENHKPAWVKAKASVVIDGPASCKDLVIGLTENGKFAVKKHGLLESSGSLQVDCGEGVFTIDGIIKGAMTSSLLINSKELLLNGEVRRFESLVLAVDTILLVGLIESVIKCKLTTEWLTLKGIISSVCSLDIDTWGLLSTGNIEMNIKNVNLHAHLVAVNSGRLTATNSSVAAPFLLNVQSSGAVASSDTQRVKIGGAEQDVLTVETIVFLMTASGLEGKSIINRSVLLFKFLTQTSSCIPDSDAMKAWNEAMPVLKSLQHNVSEKTLSEALAQCSSLTQSELELREACTLYIAVNKFVDDLLSNGIQSFHVGTLVEELIKANRLFHGLSLVKDRLLKIPELAKKARNVLKYGVKSIQEYFGFGKVDIEACGKGIRESGAWSYHAGVLQTTAGYRARFDNSWRNQGLVSTSAGDVIISSSVVTSKGKCHQGLIKAANNLVLDAEKQIQIENVRARNSKLAAESATVENIHGCSLAVSALNDTKVSDANMDYIGVDSKGSASVKNSTVNETVKIKAKDKANIRNINAKNLQTESTMVDIQRYSGQNLEVRATEKASVSDSSVDYIDLNSQGSTSLTNSTIRKSARVNAAGNAAIKNVNAENLRTHASTVDIQNHAGNSLEVLASNRANISGSSVDFIDVDSHGDASLTGSSIRVAGIRAAGNAKISNVFSENLLATAATVSVQRLQGENMEVAAKDHVTVTNSSVENAYIKSEKGSASVRDSVFKKTASIFGSRKAEAGNVQGGTISVRAENGIAKTSGRVEANTLELKGDTVKLDNNGTVVHNVGTLRIDTKRIAEISDMIQSKGMYEKMNIRDKLDLAVSDQSILLSDDVICKAALHLRAKAIDIGNATVDSAKGINLEAYFFW